MVGRFNTIAVIVSPETMAGSVQPTVLTMGLIAILTGYLKVSRRSARPLERAVDPASACYHNDLDLELGSRVFCTSHDVTGHLRAGRNAIGMMLGNGWFAAEADVPPSPSHRKPYGERPQLLLQFEAELADGERVRAASGPG